MNERWDLEYTEGAHWEKKESSRARAFTKLIVPGSHVFDAGSGSGRDSLFFARKGFQVTGIDLSSVGVARAQKRAEEENLQINFSVGNLEVLDLPDQVFDGIYSGYALQNTNIDKSIPELARVLKPGQIAFLVFFSSTHYHTPLHKDEALDKERALALIRVHFEILEHKEDDYDETDRYGKHTHHRLTIICRKLM